MVSVTYQDLHDLINVTTSDITAAKTEDLIDHAIDLLNAHGVGLSNMAGSAGSKTVTLTSAQRGAILNLARMIYRHDYVNPQQASLGPISVGATGTAEPDIDLAAKRYGRLLVTRSILRT